MIYQDATLWSQQHTRPSVVSDTQESAGLADVSRFFFYIVDRVLFCIGAVEIVFALGATLAIASVFVGAVAWLAKVVF